MATGTTLADASPMLIPWPALLLNDPPLIATGACVRTPSSVVWWMVVCVRVRFCVASRGDVEPTEMPVLAYPISEPLRTVAPAGSSTSPPQSPGAGGGQTPDTLRKKT